MQWLPLAGVHCSLGGLPYKLPHFPLERRGGSGARTSPEDCTVFRGSPTPTHLPISPAQHVTFLWRPHLGHVLHPGTVPATRSEFVTCEFHSHLEKNPTALTGPPNLKTRITSFLGKCRLWAWLLWPPKETAVLDLPGVSRRPQYPQTSSNTSDDT